MENNITSLENLRKKVVKLQLIIIAISLFIAISIMVLFQNTSSLLFAASIIIGIVVELLLSYITGANRMEKEYKERFKDILVLMPFRAAFTEIRYYKEQGLPEYIIEATDMMMMGNRYYSNDYIEGYYKGVKFERADVTIQKHIRVGKSSSTITFFNGRWMIFEFNKNFTSDLQVISKNFTFPRNNKSFFTSKEERRHKLELEDVGFNERFTVYAQDDHEAYYILTPAFMEVLKNMLTHTDGAIMLGFVNNQLHVAINTNRNSMEPPIFSSIETSKVTQDVQREIDAIINIIDGLSLDRDIYKN